MIERDWHRLYKEGWGKSIVPEAFSHPAKFRPALIRRIYTHLLEQGYIQPGATVLDPFGGVALGALEAMRLGMRWMGVELEERFVSLGQQNIDLWNRRFGALPGWGSAVVLQGDSRRLCEVLAGGVGIGAALGSPPYAVGTIHGKQTFHRSGFVEPGRTGRNSQAFTADNYGSTDGQLASLPEGEPPGVVVSSPPYTASLASDDPDKRGGLYRDPKRRNDKALMAEYGMTAGQLGAMREGQPVAASVSSPPWKNQNACNDPDYTTGRLTPGGPLHGDYGQAAGQLGIESGITFWEAAAQVMRQVHQVLAPGAVAVWVLKAFVRAGVRVDFPGQWRALGEGCGFETVEVIRCWMVEDLGAQYTLDNGLDVRKIERKSFFRALQEFKARAAEFWKSLERDEQARYLWQVRYDLWMCYAARLLENDGDGGPPRPTPARIAAAAQAGAYRDAGEPDIETDTQIDYEVVLIQRKA